MTLLVKNRNNPFTQNVDPRHPLSKVKKKVWHLKAYMDKSKIFPDFRSRNLVKSTCHGSIQTINIHSNLKLKIQIPKI